MKNYRFRFQSTMRGSVAASFRGWDSGAAFINHYQGHRTILVPLGNGKSVSLHHKIANTNLVL